jgi:hypothetical protein
LIVGNLVQKVSYYLMDHIFMLSERMAGILSTLRYRPDAESAVNILPFGSIYWKDEMPAIADLLNEDDMKVVMKMFGMRLKIWDGGALDPGEQQLWESVKSQVPDWALFKRLSLSEEQKAARAEAERQVEQEFESLGADTHESPDKP